ncbi:MAG: hypothetical protein MJE66_03390 [Proteobacteria bacterium]|nr:hypothetical protein [Pseudomonadota bacterium]
MIGRLRKTVILGLALGLLACGAGDETPEDAVRRTLAEAERSAEAKALGDFLDFVSDDYADAQGRDKEALKGVVAFYFLRQGPIHVLYRVEELTVSADARRADVTLLAGLASGPVSSLEELARLRADLLRFDLVFADADSNGDWVVVSAAWERAAPGDVVR